jgi:hypothetical protein
MKNERMLKPMIAKCLVLALSIGFVPGNIWAQSRNSPMLKDQVIATPSNADEFIEEEEEVEITDDYDLATDSDAKRKIPAENLVLLTNPVPFEEIILEGREFSTIVSGNAVPYYHVIKYTVPEGKGGYYTIDAEYIGSSYGSFTFYICNEEQYETICNKIEIKGYPVYASTPTECLAYKSYGSLGYRLEEGQDYYFISAQRNDDDNDYNLALTRDIDVTLNCSDATSAGTQALYSKGSEWHYSSNRDSFYGERNITRPEKSEYRFEGYYMEANGQGTQVIDDQGEILPEMSALTEDCTVYAHWKPFSPVSCQEIKLEGRRFSMIVSGGERPYYQAFKFTVPEDGGGSYSFYQSRIKDEIDASGYICTPEQYERLCHKIEQNKCSNFSPAQTDYLIHDYFSFGIYYNLEAGKDYYFISAGISDKEGNYKVVFERDITVTFVASDADQPPGTVAVYSKRGKWIERGGSYSDLIKVNRPQKDGFKFAGYFTGANGQGIKVIDYDGEILAELSELNNDTKVYAHWERFSPVEYEDILLSDGRLSVNCIAEKAPYYKVLRFKVPINGDGYYTFYYSSDEDVHMYGYLCNSDQYEELCRKIEADGCAQRFPNPEDYYVSYSSNLNVCHQLESGQEYFFVAARDSKEVEGEYQLMFRRDIEVVLDAGEADYQGTSVLYSSGNRWNKNEDRQWETTDIITPRREGYLFAGYFTEKNGRGNRLIDQDGYIYHENMHEFKDNTTIYALWEDKNLEFKTDYLTNGIKGVLYKHQLEIASKMTFLWWVSDGELPGGLYLDFFNGFIIGLPTETGTKTFVITASNSQIKLQKKFTITINEPTHSDSDEEQPGTWIMDENGNWRYYSSGRNYYSNEWKYLEYNGTSHWYYFGSDGYLITGWFADNTGKWYYLNPVSNGTRGAMQTGWLADPLDGYCYYLDPQTGQMAMGWVNVDGIWYYFTESGGEYSGWKWDAVAETWQYENIGRRPTGALEPDMKRN